MVSDNSKATFSYQKRFDHITINLTNQVEIYFGRSSASVCCVSFCLVGGQKSLTRSVHRIQLMVFRKCLTDVVEEKLAV